MVFDVETFNYAPSHPDRYDPTESYFGLYDIELAQNQGATPYQIRQLLMQADKDPNLNVGPKAAEWVDQNSPTSDYNYFGTNNQAGFGLNDIEALGSNYDQVLDKNNRAQSLGIPIGPAVGTWLEDNKPTPPAAFDVESFNYMQSHPDSYDHTNSYLGLYDIELAQEQGATDYQIRQLAEQADKDPNLNVGQGARDYIDQNSPTSTWNYGDYGVSGMGMHDIAGMGYDYNTVKSNLDQANTLGIPVGPLVDPWLENNKPIPPMGAMPGAKTVGNSSALGIKTPRPKGHDLNTGSTGDVFGRKKRFNPNSQLSINNTLTL